MTTWINFRELRAKLQFAQVLEHFGVEVNRKGNQHKGPCPLPGHDGDRKAPTFSAELERGIFKCFGCGGHGNVLEFAAMMRGIDPENGSGMRRVATELQELFLGGNKGAPAKSPVRKDVNQEPVKPPVRIVAVNSPLDFELKGLDPDHPYLRKRGIEGETARFFGIGMADRGSLKGRLAIPIHDIPGRLVGYAGRILNDAQNRGDNLKYLLPERRERNGAVHEFRKEELVYNRSRIQGPVQELIVVQGFTAVWWLHQSGFPNTVALMGNECSERQASIVAGLLTEGGRAWIVPGKTPTIAQAEGVLTTLAAKCSCRWVREFVDVGIVGLSPEDLGSVLQR